MLADELKFLQNPNLQSQHGIFITHLKPGEDIKIMQEVAANPKTGHCQALRNQQILEL
jgi:capsid protein